MEWVGSHIFCLVMAVSRMLAPFVHFCAPHPGLSLTVCQPPRPYCYLCPFSLPSGDHTLMLHYYHGHWGPCKHQIVSAAPSIVLPSVSFVHFDTAILRCLNAQISQVCLCAEQGTLHWITAVQLVTSVEVPTRYHAAYITQSVLKQVSFWCVCFLWGSIKPRSYIETPLAPV